MASSEATRGPSRGAGDGQPRPVRAGRVRAPARQAGWEVIGASRGGTDGGGRTAHRRQSCGPRRHRNALAQFAAHQPVLRRLHRRPRPRPRGRGEPGDSRQHARRPRHGARAAPARRDLPRGEGIRRAPRAVPDAGQGIRPGRARPVALPRPAAGPQGVRPAARRHLDRAAARLHLRPGPRIADQPAARGRGAGGAGARAGRAAVLSRDGGIREVAHPGDRLAAAGRAAEWAAMSPAARDEIFNVTNGDVFRWSTVAADRRGLRCPGGNVVPARLAEVMPRREPEWDALVARHGLVPVPLAELVDWRFVDAMLGMPYDLITSTIKIRRAGFGDCIDSGDMFVGGCSTTCGDVATSHRCEPPGGARGIPARNSKMIYLLTVPARRPMGCAH